MSSIPVQRLLEPINESEPSGSNLEYDSRFVEMERAAQPTAEQQYGETIIEGKEPEWGDVKKTALELLEQTHDLRLGMYLTMASIRTNGLAGFRDGLAILHGFVEKFWPSVHPQLDPDDDNDPTIRVNTLAGLCDNTKVLTPLRKTPLVSSRSAGQFSRADLAYALGELPFPGSDEEKPKMSLIDAAFLDVPLEKLQSDTEAATEAVALIKGIESTVTKQVGAGNMKGLDAAVKEVEGIRKILAERLVRRTPVAESESAGGEAVTTNGAAQHGEVFSNGEITSRVGAIKAIENVCRYFERYEPSSPLPLLLHRAVRLSAKSFLEIMRDISPDGLTQAESLGGMTSEEYQKLVSAVRVDEPAPRAASPTRPAAQASSSSDSDY